MRTESAMQFLNDFNKSDFLSFGVASPKVINPDRQYVTHNNLVLMLPSPIALSSRGTRYNASVETIENWMPKMEDNQCRIQEFLFSPPTRPVKRPAAEPSTGAMPSNQKRLRMPCIFEGCDRVAQSKELCKLHGGGLVCTHTGCKNQRQSNGRCRSHGGGKRCSFAGCPRAAQRSGKCHSHGGVKLCFVQGCMKKDRGLGACVMHGGGKKCIHAGCERSARKQQRCTRHFKELKVDRNQYII